MKIIVAGIVAATLALSGCFGSKARQPETVVEYKYVTKKPPAEYTELPEEIPSPDFTQVPEEQQSSVISAYLARLYGRMKTIEDQVIKIRRYYEDATAAPDDKPAAR